MFDIKSLLGDSIKRNHIASQVTTARILEEAQKAIAEVLPPGRSGDAKAVSTKDGLLSIDCLNAPASHRISSQERVLLDHVVRALPTADLRKVRTRIVQRFGGRHDVIE